MAIVVASLMVLVAAYCAARPVAARRLRRSTDRDADLTHVLMGLAMAAMIELRLWGPAAGALVVVFCGAAVWFGGRWFGGRWFGGRWLGGRWFGGRWFGGRWFGGRWLGGRGLGAGRVGSRGCGHPLTHALACGVMAIMLLASSGVAAAAAPALALGLVLALACSLIFAVGRLAPAPVPAGVVVARSGEDGAPPQLAPRLSGCCQIMMGAAMIWMLLPMV